MKTKLVIIAVATLILLASLTGCTKKQECDFCGELKQCEQADVYGSKMYICEECVEEIKEMFE